MKVTLEHRYHPRGSAREVFERRDPELLVSGPAGTGKSRACLEKVHLLALVNPGMRGLIVRKTAVSLTSTALVTWREHVVKEALATGLVSYYGGSAQEPAGYRYSNGSFIGVGGMDKATRIMSSEYDVVYVQEATELTQDDWEAITTRLRNGVISFQQLLADCNPSTPTHWLKVRADAGRTQILESRHEENPTLVNSDGTLTSVGEAYLSKLDNLTGVRYHRLRKGSWVAAEGIIYEEYDSSLHLVPRFDIPETWVRWWTVDFGYTNPFVLQCWAEDPDGRLYLYREIYKTRTLVEEHGRQIMDIVAPLDDKGRRQWIEPKPRAVITDHDAEGRATFEKAIGISTAPAHKKVLEGIQATQGRLKFAGDGKPRIYILHDSLVERDHALVDAKKPTCTAEELPGYIWQNNDKEAPVKENDHGCDAMRYLVADRDLGGRPRVRFI